MPISFYKNNTGRFANITQATGLQQHTGWWNSLAAGDVDNDGDIDYVAGNLGLNSFYKASTQQPVNIYAGDFNNDGGYDAIPTVYLPGRDGLPAEFAAFGRDDMIKQMIGFKQRFTNYQQYAVAPIGKVLTKQEIEKALKLSATQFATCCIINNGNGTFALKPLPAEAQVSAVYAMSLQDVDKDENLDLLLVGNDYGAEIATGRYDALNGLLLKGDGRGGFTALPVAQSGFYVPGDAKALATIAINNSQLWMLASQNQAALKTFKCITPGMQLLQAGPGAISLQYVFKNGKMRKQEMYTGNSFYTQCGRSIAITAQVKYVVVTHSDGSKKTIHFSH
jgi:hypothetical protein